VGFGLKENCWRGIAEGGKWIAEGIGWQFAREQLLWIICKSEDKTLSKLKREHGTVQVWGQRH
jgi:hypothetical protein